MEFPANTKLSHRSLSRFRRALQLAQSLRARAAPLSPILPLQPLSHLQSALCYELRLTSLPEALAVLCTENGLRPFPPQHSLSTAGATSSITSAERSPLNGRTSSCGVVSLLLPHSSDGAGQQAAMVPSEPLLATPAGAQLCLPLSLPVSLSLPVVQPPPYIVVPAEISGAGARPGPKGPECGSPGDAAMNSRSSSGHACTHYASWRRIRCKKGYNHFLCEACGNRWRVFTSRGRRRSAGVGSPPEGEEETEECY